MFETEQVTGAQLLVFPRSLVEMPEGSFNLVSAGAYGADRLFPCIEIVYPYWFSFVRNLKQNG